MPTEKAIAQRVAFTALERMEEMLLERMGEAVREAVDLLEDGEDEGFDVFGGDEEAKAEYLLVKDTAEFLKARDEVVMRVQTAFSTALAEARRKMMKEN